MSTRTKILVLVGIFVVSVAVSGMTVWLSTRSDGPRTFETPTAAVKAVCGTSALTPHGWWGSTDYLGTDGVQRVMVPKASGGVAVVRRTSDGMFSIESCDSDVRIAP
jgi:hypothetical protein